MNKMLYIIFISLLIHQAAALGYESGVSKKITDNYGTNLSLNDCLAMARTANPAFLAQIENYNAYTERADKAKSNMFPNMYLSWSGTGHDESYRDVYSSAFIVTQPIYQGNRLVNNYRIAEMDQSKSGLDVKNRFLYLEYYVKTEWYTLIRSLELKKETENAYERLKKHVEIATHFYSEGWIWRTDVLQAEVELARGEQDLISAENDIAISRATLNALLQRDVDAELNPIYHALEVVPCKWTLALAIETALKNRIDLRQAEIDFEKQKLAIEITKSGHLPDVDLKISVSRSGDSFSMDHGASDKSIGLTASWLIWDFGKTGHGIAAAKSDLKRKELDIMETRKNLLLDVKKAWLSVTEAEKKVSVLKKALQQSEENFRVNRIRYSERLGTAGDVLDAQDLLTRTRKDYITGIASYLISLAALEYQVAADYDHEAVRGYK